MSLGEFDIITKYFARRAKRADVQLGIGDDAAVLDVRADRKLVLAMDTIVEGVHFLESAAPDDIGYRALAVNLSDLAAMGAEPSWMSLSLSVPNANERWLERFAGGLFELADEHDVALIGGDTVRGPLVITVQVGGWIEPDRFLTRAAARPGDEVFVSGVPGEAAAGLALLRAGSEQEGDSARLRQRFLRPKPRIELGRALRTIASAAMDISDGLLGDLEKLCAASECGARIELEALPSSTAMRALFDPEECLRLALTGGDDYELLFSVAPANAAAVRARAIAGTPVVRIGAITAERGVRCFLGGKIHEVECTGYDHFARQ
jgi:thiamine-monophosphate kinase